MNAANLLNASVVAGSDMGHLCLCAVSFQVDDCDF